MGVLEDAIRDHLELKRKHGASDEEVQREEAEALGPARREFEGPAEPEAEQAAEPSEHGEEPPPGADVGEDEPPLAEPEPIEGETEAHESPPPEPPAVERPPVVGEQEADFAEEDEADRLWTDRRPPRDFDFD